MFYTRSMAVSLVPGKKPRINPKYSSFKILIRKSKIHRAGIFAGEDIPKGRKIIEYTGERINRKGDAPPLQRAIRADLPLHP